MNLTLWTSWPLKCLQGIGLTEISVDVDCFTNGFIVWGVIFRDYAGDVFSETTKLEKIEAFLTLPCLGGAYNGLRRKTWLTWELNVLCYELGSGKSRGPVCRNPWPWSVHKATGVKIGDPWPWDLPTYVLMQAVLQMFPLVGELFLAIW